MASGRYRRLWCDWPSRACPLHSPGWSLCQKRRQAKQDHTANPRLKSRGCSNSWMLAGFVASVNTIAIRVVSAATTNGPRSFPKALDFGFGDFLLVRLFLLFPTCHGSIDL